MKLASKREEERVVHVKKDPDGRGRDSLVWKLQQIAAG